MPTRTRHEFQHLLALLSPEALRGQVLPYAQAREDFQADTQAATWEAVHEEVVRFVGHMNQRTYASRSREPWPRHLAEKDSEELLRAVYGVMPRRGAMLEVERHGVRALLDRLTEQFQDNRLRVYLNGTVIGHLARLTPDERYPFAQAYLDKFRVLEGVEVQHPLNYVMLSDHTAEWQRALHEHARLILRGP